MSSYYETGHIKNGANLLKLNQTIATFGATYNPSNNAIKLAGLGTLATNANTKLSDVSTNFTNWKNATNARELAFDPLRWTNLRSCAFINDFEKPKIIWGLISGNWSFTLDEIGYFLTSASFFLISKVINQKFILGLFNSRLYQYYFIQIGEYTAGGAFVLKKTTIEKFIIPQLSDEKQLPFIKLVDKILTLKAKDTKADTLLIENELDNMVYKLYELTPEEIVIVEENTKK